MKSIFVQIASYRDKELLPTLRDIVSKSSGNNQLNFGIMWQKDDTETIEEFSKMHNVRVMSCDWKDSRGLGWARSNIQSLYKDEDYTLQLDSHHRFLDNWDDILIDMFENLTDKSPKPLLTAYASGYDPLNDKSLIGQPCRIMPHDFKKSGTIWFNPNPIPNYKDLNGPINARLVSGHYFFTTGKHCKEYVYDPDMYFAGDEICLSVRSYTLGYDLYHPHVNIVWHHYGRLDRAKHWNDHSDSNKNKSVVEKSWMERDIYSKRRIRKLLTEEDNDIDLGIYGLGKERSIEEYETYSGIDFKNKRIQKCAISGIEPPVKFDSEKSYNEDFKKQTPVRLMDWGRNDILKHIDNVSLIRLQFLNLRQDVIHEQLLTPSFVKNNTSIASNVVGDYVPMRFILVAFDKDNNIIKQVGSDLRHGIHWN